MQRSAGRHGFSCCRGGNGGSLQNSSPFQRQKGLKGLRGGRSPREVPEPKPRPPEVPPPRHDRKCASPPKMAPETRK